MKVKWQKWYAKELKKGYKTILKRVIERQENRCDKNVFKLIKIS